MYGPGTPDTVRWHTGQSGVLDQGTLGFLCFFLFEPQLDLFIVFVLNLYAPIEYII
jgi:hypothetical protein